MRLVHVVLLLALPLPAMAQSAAGDPAAGRSTAMAMCTNCHFVGPDQRQPAIDSVPSFDKLARDPAVTEARLRSFITRPHPPMPDPQLSRQDLDNIVSYILARRATLR
jgi:cytochrome c